MSEVNAQAASGEVTNSQGGQDVNGQLPLLSTATAGESKASGSDGNTDTQTQVTTSTDNDSKSKELAAEAKKEGEPVKSVIPEKYEFKLPEGVNLDSKVMTEVEDVFKKAGLSQEQAQKLMDFNLELSKRNQDEILVNFEKQKKDWIEETRKELGSEVDKRMSFAAKGRDYAATPELMNILKDSGLEANIHVIKFFEKIGKTISEDSFLEGKASAGIDLSKLSAHEKMEYHIKTEQERLAKIKK
jgi:hypothetical protein